MLQVCTPIVYGSSKVASFHRKALGINDFSFNIIRDAAQANPKNANLIICGSFDIASIKPIIEKYYGSWKSEFGGANGVSLESVSIKKKEIGFINRTGATQCALQWNKVSPAVTDKDQLAFAMANDIFNDVLFKEIREKGGKTYGIASSQRASKYSNLFTIACSVRSSELFNICCR